MNLLPMNLLPLRLPPMRRSRHRVLILAAAFGLGMLAAPVAHAFTLDNQASTNSDGSAKYVDPDQQISRFGNGNNGQTTIKQGDATFHFGPAQQPFNQRYNADRMFDPIGRPESER